MQTLFDYNTVVAVKNVITCDGLVVRLRSLCYLTASTTRALSLDPTTSTELQVQVLTDVRYATVLHTVKTLCPCVKTPSLIQRPLLPD